MEFSGMTGEQKAWMILAGMGKAVSPLLLYICMPSLCMALGYLLFHGEMSRAEFFRYGGNFYTAAGMACSLFLLYWRSSRRGESFCEDATLFPESFRAGRAALFVLFGGLCRCLFPPSSHWEEPGPQATGRVLRGCWRDRIFCFP